MIHLINSFQQTASGTVLEFKYIIPNIILSQISFYWNNMLSVIDSMKTNWKCRTWHFIKINSYLIHSVASIGFNEDQKKKKWNRNNHISNSKLQKFTHFPWMSLPFQLFICIPIHYTCFIHIYVLCLCYRYFMFYPLNATSYMCIFVSYFYFVSFLFKKNKSNFIQTANESKKIEKTSSTMHDQSDSRSLSDSLDNIPSNVFGPDGLVTRFTLPLSYGRKEARQKRVG